MMTCQECGGDTAVIYSKRMNTGTGCATDLVRRRRKCLRCAQRFWSYERRSDDPQELWQALEEARREKDLAVRNLRRLVAFVKEIAGEPEACAAAETAALAAKNQNR